MAPLDLGLAFLAGFLGSAHCVGMCGGFALALAHRAGSHVWVGQGAYHGGRVLTYALLGTLAGAFGYALFLARGAQLAVSFGLGLVLTALGIALCGGVRRSVLDRMPVPKRLQRALAAVVGRPGPLAAGALGMLNGLLPCGLVLALLVQAAAAGSPARGALTMAAFGLGTFPALALVVGVGQRWSAARRVRVQRWAGVFVIALGALTVARATPLHHVLPHGVHVHGQEATDAWCRTTAP